MEDIYVLRMVFNNSYSSPSDIVIYNLVGRSTSTRECDRSISFLLRMDQAELRASDAELSRELKVVFATEVCCV
jgi:hypothetical protein